MAAREAVLALALMPALIGTAHAGDRIVSRLDSSAEQGVTVSTLSFAFESCEEECHVATLTCESGSIGFIHGDVDARHVAKAITADEQQIVLKASGKSFDFIIYEMTFAEMTGSWWVTARLAPSAGPQELRNAIASAQAIEASIAVQTTTLPVDTNVRTWAKDCK